MRVITGLADWAPGERIVLVAPAADQDERRALLRGLAARVAHVPADVVVISHREGRAPRLVAPGLGLHLSASSRDGLAALAVAPAPIGVDIERVGAEVQPPWNVLHPQERAWLKDQPSPECDHAFAALWAAKEAYGKALGLGLAREPSGFAVLPRGAGTWEVFDRDRPGRSAVISTAEVTHGGGTYAVALAEFVA